MLQAGILDPTLLPQVEQDALLFLLPDDDPAFVEREIGAAVSMVRRGHNAYLHHVQVADLPEVAPVSLEPRPGARQVRYGEAGEIIANEVLGEDGAWHATDEPPPGPRDDDAGLASW